MAIGAKPNDELRLSKNVPCYDLWSSGAPAPRSPEFGGRPGGFDPPSALLGPPRFRRPGLRAQRRETKISNRARLTLCAWELEAGANFDYVQAQDREVLFPHVWLPPLDVTGGPELARTERRLHFFSLFKIPPAGIAPGLRNWCGVPNLSRNN